MAVEMNHSEQKKESSKSMTTPARAKWTPELDQRLLDVLGPLVSKDAGEDKKKLIYPKDINWEMVSEALAPDASKSASEVHARWNALSAKVRKLRTVEEILSDVKALCEERSEQNAQKTASKARQAGMPKRPMTAFFVFLSEKRPRLREKYPNISHVELTQRLSKKWKELPEEKRQKYILRYKEEMEQYNKEMVKYLAEKFPNEKLPASAFDLWKVTEEKKIKTERPDISQKKLGKKLKRRWENLEDADKAPFQKKATRSRHNFQKKLLKLQ